MKRSQLLALLGLSLLLNGAVIVGVLVHASRFGGVHYFGRKLGLESAPRPASFPVLGRQLFGPLPRGARDVVVAGDSQVQNAPLADLLTGIKQRGIGGQTVRDVQSWISQVLHPAPRRLVLLAGTNDALQREPSAVFAARYAALLDDAHRVAPRTQLVAVTIPPGTGALAGDMRRLDGVIKRVAPEHGAKVVDIYPLLASPRGELRPEFTRDGIHLSPAGYARVAGRLRAAALGRRP